MFKTGGPKVDDDHEFFSTVPVLNFGVRITQII